MCVSSRASGPFVVGIAFIIIPGIMMAVFILIIISTINKKNRLDGKVEAYDIKDIKYRDSDGNIMYTPIYYFNASNNQSYTCKASSSSSFRSDKTKKLVYYNTTDPDDCLTEYDLSTNTILYFVPLFLLVFIAVGVFLIIKSVRVCCYVTAQDYNYVNSEMPNVTPGLVPGSADFNNNYYLTTPVYNNYNNPINYYPNTNNMNYPTASNY